MCMNYIFRTLCFVYCNAIFNFQAAERRMKMAACIEGKFSYISVYVSDVCCLYFSILYVNISRFKTAFRKIYWRPLAYKKNSIAAISNFLLIFRLGRYYNHYSPNLTLRWTALVGNLCIANLLSANANIRVRVKKYATGILSRHYYVYVLLINVGLERVICDNKWS